MTSFPPIAELVAHDAEMLLLDRVVALDGKQIRTEATIREDNIFFEAGCGVPAYVGFELMAQAISAYDGLRRRESGKPPAVGFLLGCRRYESARPWLRAGETLTIEAASLLGDEGMASFDCRILDEGGGVLASAVVSVYRPKDGGAAPDGGPA